MSTNNEPTPPSTEPDAKEPERVPVQTISKEQADSIKLTQNIIGSLQDLNKKVEILIAQEKINKETANVFEKRMDLFEKRLDLFEKLTEKL